MEFSRQKYWSELPFPFPGDLPNLGINPRYPAVQEYSLPAELPGRSKNTGVGSLSLLQRIFPTPGIEPGSPALQVDFYQLSHLRGQQEESGDTKESAGPRA